MKVNQFKDEQLSVLLSSLEPETARKLLQAIEHGGLQQGNSDAAHLIATHLHEILNADGIDTEKNQFKSNEQPSDRSDENTQPLPQFSLPFADLLVEETASAKQAGRISQSSVAAVWIWLMRDLLPGKLPGLVENIKTALSESDDDGLLGNTKAMYAAIAAALETNLSSLDPHSSSYMKLASHVGGASVLEDAREMLLAINLGDQIAQIRTRLPVQIHTLRDDSAELYIKIYKEFDEQTDGFGWLALLTIMRRLKKPAEIVWLVTKIVGSKYESDICAHKTALICECAMYDMETAARNAARLINEQRDIEAVFAEIDKFYILADEFSSELDIDLKGEWGVNLIRVRNILAEAIRGQISDAPRRVKAALYCGLGHETGSDTKTPLLTKGPDEEDLRSAEFSVRLLLGLRQYLEQLPINAEYTALNDHVLQFVENMGDAIVGKVREADSAEKAAVEAYMKANIYFTKIMFGQDAADLMRRQAYVATHVKGKVENSSINS